MEENKNYEFLQQQVFYTGIGDALDKQLAEQMQKGAASFTLEYKKAYAEGEVTATLYFQKSKQSELYFFNRMGVSVQTHNGETKAQSFLIAPKGANFTVKEAYNLLQGRAVYKEGLVYKKDGVEKKYNAWNELNPNDVDANGNQKITRYNEKYGYNVEKTLASETLQSFFPELRDPKVMSRAIDELKRGDRFMVHMIDPETNNEVKHYLVGSPYDRTTKVFDLSMNHVELKVPKLERENKAQQSNGNKQKQEQKETAKEEVRQKRSKTQRV